MAHNVVFEEVTVSNEFLAYAAGYRLGQEWSVIPVEPQGKKPLLDWKPYQEELCTEKDLENWWKRWPKANIGVIAGKISGITVVDVDSKEGLATIKPYIEGIKTPIARTQKGGRHYYFKYVPGIPNAVRRMTGVDLRNDGGFVVAPPSSGVFGPYEWVKGFEAGMIPFAEMPADLVEVFKQPRRPDVAAPQKPLDALAFEHGQRNVTMFNYALKLGRGGVTDENVLMSMVEPLAVKCNPPVDRNELLATVRSALKYVTTDKKEWTSEIKEWIECTGGKDFSLSNIYGDMGAKEELDKKAIRMAILRMVDGGILERVTSRHGWYRKIISEKEEIDIFGADTAPLDFKMPLDVHDYINVYAGNVLVIAGEPNVGKTAFMIETVRMNQDNFDIEYHTSEMGAAEMKIRLQLYPNLPLTSWKFRAFERLHGFHDAIDNPDNKKVYLFDFLELTDEFWKVAGYLSKIHEKLAGKGLAVVAIQKNRGKERGLGGDLGMQKPRLYLLMSRLDDYSGNVVQMVKAKNWKTTENPNGMLRRFNVIGGYNVTSKFPWMSVSSYDAKFDTVNGYPRKDKKKFS